MDRSRLIVPITSHGYAAGTAGRLTASVVSDHLASITPRDLNLLNLLAEHKTFTTEQICALAFGSLGRTRNRCNTLHARGVLDRFRHYHRPGSQSWRWTLGPTGAALVAAARGATLPRPAAVRDTTARLATSPTLAHLIGVNGFFVALAAYARHHDSAHLNRWYGEVRARDTAGNLVRPDGHGVWSHHGARVPFWLEYDTGTEPLTRVVGKLDGYAHLAGTRRAYPVLFWLPGAVRETNLHDAISRTNLPAGVVVATASAEHAAGHGGPAGPVWHVPGHAGRLTLATLPIPAGAA